ncbi:MAG TPA: helicase-related protein, partial [Planctomycetaceae bacterium]|nr:helicase-related protein [Planctomycetaceae bacterium]
AALVRRPPQILVTTPESLYLMLTSAKARETLRGVETVIVDELHALVRDKRGSHLALTLERLEHLAEGPVQRIGLSATQRPIERTARFLVGARDCRFVSAGEEGDLAAESDPLQTCAIVDVGHRRQLDLAIETPVTELSAVCSNEQWDEVIQRVASLVESHHSTLIFVNTRRLAERVTHRLTAVMGEEAVSSHHGSLAAPIRLETEQRLKSGQLKAVVATASLELGLDVGHIDLVIQIGSPRSIATFLQRVGRSGHALGLIPKGRLFALTRDELIECMALVRSIRAGILDAVEIPQAPLDILAQQIVAETAHTEWNTDELFALVRRADPYRDLSREQFDGVLELLSEGLTSNTGRGRVYLHHDRVQRKVRARKGASIAATSNGGAIPEIASYRVVAEPDRVVVGSVDEDFAIESLAGDVFLLGNTSWRVRGVRGGEMIVADAAGAPPSIPFWIGEAPGRTFELSAAVSHLREELERRCDDPAAAEVWLVEETHCAPQAAQQIVLYAAAQKAALGLLPTQKRVIFERFFDESGGMQMVIHAPFGGRINRAWGLAMRKRFCRSFDFELQATADDDGIILSLGPQHSFPLESMFPMLNSQNARPLLEQAVLAVPMFQTRWRWNVTRALLVMRSQKGKKVPPPLQRFRADDLLTAVFPKLTGCQENTVGDIELPDHPLVNQTMEDCLFEPLDIAGLNSVLDRVAAGEIEFLARDTREPSPFCYELLNSERYTFLDGGEPQERRARAVATRRSLTVESVSDLGRLDPEAIARVCREAQPLIRDVDELHDALLSRILLPTIETAAWTEWMDRLIAQRRATVVRLESGQSFWAPAERLPAVKAVFPASKCEPEIEIPEGVRTDWTGVDALVAIVRGWLEVSGPTTATATAARLGLRESQAEAALESLEGEGLVLRGKFNPPGTQFTPEAGFTPVEAVETAPVEWCHRRLLARIHRFTLEGLRRQIEPVSVDVFWRFLSRRHGLIGDRRAGVNGLFEASGMLQGIDASAVAWERDLLAARVENYESAWLDELCLTGEVGWGRLFPPKRDPERSRPMASLTRVAPISLYLRNDLGWLLSRATSADLDTLSSPGREVYDLLAERGAMFATDLLQYTRMLPAQLDDVLGELIAQGWATADGFAGLRRLIRANPDGTLQQSSSRPGLARSRAPAAGVGRWSLWRPSLPPEAGNEAVEQWAWQLLRRWGVVFRDLLIREPGAPPWFELLQVHRRLEARGELRGGRFIVGVAGEQFALGDTVRQLRALRDAGDAQELALISAVDPLNLVGILTGEARVPSTASNRIAYIDGRAVAALIGGEVQTLAPLALERETAVRGRLLGREPRPVPVESIEASETPSIRSRPRERSAPRNQIPRPKIW